MLYLVVVSHNHEKYVKSLLDELEGKIISGVTIVVKDNTHSDELKKICFDHETIYLTSQKRMGFGENNNFAIQYIKSKYDVTSEDYILFVNPDVLITRSTMLGLIEFINSDKPDMFTIDLFKDVKFKKRDLFIRHFPDFFDFLSSYIKGINKSIIDRDSLLKPIAVDWCAGSFIGIRFNIFMELNGFDENYFMYCEDLDLCYRSNLLGYKLIYNPHFRALHYAHHDNRRFLSKPFIWHAKSIFRFLLKKTIFRRRDLYLSSTKSTLKNNV
jgi:GT2 family glycosyltransferase